MRGRLAVVVVVAGTVIGALLVGAEAGEAAFPGENGLLIYTEEAQGPSKLFTVEAGVGSPTPFTASEAVGHAAWSPDGRRVAFDRFDKGSMGLWVADADGGSLQRITSPIFTDDGRDLTQWNPAWSPDGLQLVFEERTDYYGYISAAIAVIDAEPGAVSSVIVPGDDFLVRHEDPVWSPDGTRIAFVSNFETPSDIWTVSPQGGGIRQVTSTEPTKSKVDWSPDGTTLVYQEGTSDEAEVMLVDALGGDPRQLTDNSFFDGQPAWSPDGSKIAFVTQGGGEVYRELRVMNTSGGAISAPIVAANTILDAPDWQPVAPPEATTTSPPVGNSDRTTTTRATSVFGRSATNPTLPTPAPEDGEPILLLDRMVTRVGTVVVATGSDFPPLAVVRLRWEPGLGEAIVAADVDGVFRRSMLVMPRDTTGPRRLVAAVEGVTLADAPLLVTLGSYQPSGTARSLVTRR